MYFLQQPVAILSHSTNAASEYDCGLTSALTVTASHNILRAMEEIMPLILFIVTLILLKYFEIGFVENISWWWVAGLGAVAFIWFEFLERIFGLDKRRAFDEMEKARKDRVEKSFKK